MLKNCVQITNLLIFCLPRQFLDFNRSVKFTLVFQIPPGNAQKKLSNVSFSFTKAVTLSHSLV